MVSPCVVQRAVVVNGSVVVCVEAENVAPADDFEWKRFGECHETRGVLVSFGGEDFAVAVGTMVRAALARFLSLPVTQRSA